MFNNIDNVASKAVKKNLEEENTRIHMVELHNHCVNTVEHMVQMFKNHTIAGLSTCDERFPLVLWCKLIKQSQDTLNMLSTSLTYPQVSAYHVLGGPHDFNQGPFAVTGCHIETKTSWGPRPIDA